MIKQSTILIAQPIADKLVNEKRSLAKQAGGLLGSLNEKSWGPFPYLPDQAAIQIPEATEANTDHAWLLDQQSNGLSDAVNKCFGQISTYLKPFAKSLADDITATVSFDTDGIRAIYDAVHIQYSRLDDAFLNSVLCPAELPTQSIDYSEILLSNFKIPGVLEGMTKEKWDEYLALKPSDYSYVFEEYSPWEFFLEFIQDNDWSDIFQVEGTRVDVTSAGSGRSNLSALVTGYFVFSKLQADDQPIEGLTGVDLATYRQYVNRVHSYLTAGLVFAKRFYDGLAPQGIAVISSKLKNVQGGWIPGVSLLTGNINIGITKAAIDQLGAAHPDLAISEIIIGKAYASVVEGGKDASGNILTDAEKFNQAFQRYKSRIVTAVSSHIKTIVSWVVTKRLDKFQSDNPAILEKLPKPEGVLLYQILSSSMDESIKRFSSDYAVFVESRQVPVGSFVMGSDLIVEFAYKLGMNLAGDILRFSTCKAVGDIPEINKREMLTEAVVKALVSNLLK